MKPSELFYTCWTGNYTQAGESVSYMFKEQGDELYIYFQGSSEPVDWIRNFLFKKRPYKDMEIPYKVHRGFLAAWKEVEDIVIAKLTEKDWKAVYVVGYSHGAALAMLCHECVWFHLTDKERVHGYAFEGPRVYGSWTVKKELKERWKNFTLFRNNTDIVTFVPPWILGYCHVGTIQPIGQDKTYGVLKSHYPENVYQSLKEWEAKQGIK